MPKAIFNIAYTLPNAPSNLHGNARAEYQARRKFYDLTADYNFFSYALDGKKVVKNANAEHYFTREGTNSGLFNFDGAMSKEQVSDLKAKLKNTKSVIWHGFISFDEETSKGFNTQENAVKFMCQTFRAFLQRTHLNEKNVELYAALHDDTDHRHIHFAFFEKEPKSCDKNGNVGYTKRGKISQIAIDNYLVSANMHLSEHSAEYYTARDRAIGRLNEIRKQRAETVPMFRSRRQELNVALSDLVKRLPKTGRLQYNSANMAELRPAIDRVAELMIASDPAAKLAHGEMLKQFARIKDETMQIVSENKLIYTDGKRLSKDEIAAAWSGELTGMQSVNPENIDYFDRLQNDYKARLGNVVLGVCKDMKWQQAGEQRRARVNDRNLKIAAKNRRRKRESILAGASRLLAAVCYGARADFIKSVRQNEYEQEAQRRYGRAN